MGCSWIGADAEKKPIMSLSETGKYGDMYEWLLMSLKASPGGHDED